jgi:hypothetical protein
MRRARAVGSIAPDLRAAVVVSWHPRVKNVTARRSVTDRATDRDAADAGRLRASVAGETGRASRR